MKKYIVWEGSDYHGLDSQAFHYLVVDPTPDHEQIIAGFIDKDDAEEYCEKMNEESK